MKRLLIACVLLFALSSCSLNSQFVDAVDGAWSVIGPEYTAYVQADPKLDDDTKTTRLRTAQLLTETIAEAQR
jgi:hypothetical protein